MTIVKTQSEKIKERVKMFEEVIKIQKHLESLEKRVNIQYQIDAKRKELESLLSQNNKSTAIVKKID